MTLVVRFPPKVCAHLTLFFFHAVDIVFIVSRNGFLNTWYRLLCIMILFIVHQTLFCYNAVLILLFCRSHFYFLPWQFVHSGMPYKCVMNISKILAQAVPSGILHIRPNTYTQQSPVGQGIQGAAHRMAYLVPTSAGTRAAAALALIYGQTNNHWHNRELG